MKLVITKYHRPTYDRPYGELCVKTGPLSLDEQCARRDVDTQHPAWNNGAESRERYIELEVANLRKDLIDTIVQQIDLDF